jgi:cyanate lyase
MLRAVFRAHLRGKCSKGNVPMDKKAMCSAVLEAKRKQGVSWASLSEAVGMAEVYVASCVYGENSMRPEVAAKLCKALSLGEDVAEALTAFPLKGQSLGQSIPTDPLVYRFYEIMQVYGMAMKDVIQEKFGDGIMSAIDFELDIEKETNPKGDRVVVTLNGKFLPYKAW